MKVTNMKFVQIVKTLALISAAFLVACSTKGGPAVPASRSVATGTAVLTTIVGLGDSLTAGEQSDGVLGATGVTLPDASTLFSPIEAIGMIPPTQENGWFSLFYSDAKGLTWDEQATPSTSVLPLVAGPGLGDQILPANPAYTGGVPFSTVPGRSSCDTFNSDAYTYGNSSTTVVRVNPTATTYDLGIPSLTLHEAIAMYQPLSPQCTALFNPPANTEEAEIDALQSLVGGESQYFYPVMEKYSPPGSEVTPLAAAVALRPTLTTVWLGANDLLKYIFSGGTASGLDTTQALVKSDMTTVINTLKNAGSNVIVADLPDVIETPQFAVVPNPSSQTLCEIQTYLACLIYDVIENSGGTFAEAEGLAEDIQVSNSQLAGNSYLTESGVIYVLEEYLSSGTVTIPTTGCSAGTCLGTYYVTASFATQVEDVNNAINAGIQAAATATGAAYVPVDQIFAGIYSGSGTYFDEAASIDPGICCTLAFGGGLVSLDGLHPSDTGYALIASYFVQAANTAFGTSLTAISPASAWSGAGGIYAPYPDPYAPH